MNTLQTYGIRQKRFSDSLNAFISTFMVDAEEMTKLIKEAFSEEAYELDCGDETITLFIDPYEHMFHFNIGEILDVTVKCAVDSGYGIYERHDEVSCKINDLEHNERVREVMYRLDSEWLLDNLDRMEVEEF